jgi:hypothetical protein
LRTNQNVQTEKSFLRRQNTLARFSVVPLPAFDHILKVIFSKELLKVLSFGEDLGEA